MSSVMQKSANFVSR